MKIKTVFFSIIFLLSSQSFLAQEADGTPAPNRSRWVIFNIGYRSNVNRPSVINSGNGLSFEAGFNFGKLISKNLTLGLYGGWSWRDVLWATSFRKEFVNDYSAAIDPERQLTGLDTAVMRQSAKLFADKKGRSIVPPGCESTSFHNYALYYGIIVKLPFKYAPALKVYTGIMSTFYRGPAGIVTDRTEYNAFSLKRPMHGFELVLLSGRDVISKKLQAKAALLKYFAFSIYYERYDFSAASLQFDDGDRQMKIPLSRFTNSAFLSKYKNEVAAGVKLSVLIL